MGGTLNEEISCDADRRGAAELAERIQALKTAHTIEATPQRIGTGRGTAEEPVTARIRRQMERTLAAAPSVMFEPAGQVQPIQLGE